MNESLLKLPVGIERFQEIRKSGFYYIDKTGLIEQLLENWGKANLFTRPRRFGKTLNMSMLRCFFEIGTDPTLFDGLYISKNKRLCEEYMGKYPVLFLSLKGVEGLTFEEAKFSLSELLADEIRRFKFLLGSDKLDEEEKNQYRELLTMRDEDNTMFGMKLKFSLKRLSELLYKHYGKNTIILIDEYDGYHFGNADIYCPWDVVNHVDRLKHEPGAKPQSYWLNSSGNGLVKRFISKANKTTRDEIERLVAGEAIEKSVRLELTYDEIDNSIDNLWSVLFTTGYLTLDRITEQGMYCLVIPNKEVREVYVLQIQEWFKGAVLGNTEKLTAFWKAMEEGDTESVEHYLNKLLSNTISVFDTKAREEEKENSYHTLLVGLLAGNSDWLVKSNVEAGEGFADIIVETENPDAGIIIELKYTKQASGLDKACERAITQIKDRRYEEYLKNDGRNDIIFYGMAFCRKRCRIIAEKTEYKGSN